MGCFTHVYYFTSLYYSIQNNLQNEVSYYRKIWPFDSDIESSYCARELRGMKAGWLPYTSYHDKAQLSKKYDVYSIRITHLHAGALLSHRFSSEHGDALSDFKFPIWKKTWKHA